MIHPSAGTPSGNNELSELKPGTFMSNKMLFEDPGNALARQTMSTLMAQQFKSSADVAAAAAAAHLHLPVTSFAAYHHPAAHYEGSALANLHAGGPSGLYHASRDQQATFSHA